VNFLDPGLFFSDSLRDVAMATDFCQNLVNELYSTRWHFATDSNIAIPIYVCQEHNFYYILVMVGLLTLEITQGVSVPFGTRRQTTYRTKYLSKYWSKLHQLFSIGRLMYADYKTEIIFVIVEETLLW